MCGGMGEIYWLWKGQLAEGLFFSMRRGIGGIEVGVGWTNFLVQRDGFGDVGWVIV